MPEIPSHETTYSVVPSVRRHIVVLIIAWSAAIALSLAWNLRAIQRDSVAQARIAARTAFQKDLVYRRWAASHGGVYVPQTPDTPPNPYLSNIEERDITTPSGRALTLVNPAYMTRQVFELDREQYGLHGHITSLNPIRKENAADPWERTALEAFERGETEVSSLQEIDGALFLRFMRPMVAERPCLSCHAAQGYREGEIRGGISVSVPMAPYREAFLGRAIPIGAGHGALWLFGALALVVGGRGALRRERARVETEEQLQESEERLQQIYAAADNVGLVTTDLGGVDTSILDFSPGAEKLFGYTKQEIMGERVAVLYPPGIVTDLPQMQDELRQGKKGYSGEALLRRKGGEEFPALFTLHPRRDALGELVGAVGVTIDISDRMKIEETIRRLVDVSSRHFGESFFESMASELAATLRADYTIIGELDRDGSSISTIAAVADGELAEGFSYDLGGTPCANVVGRSVCSYPHGVADQFPEDKLLKEMAVEGYIGVPLFSSAGDVLGILAALYRSQVVNAAFAESILQIFSARVGSELERLRSEQAMRERDQQYHSMLQSTMDGFWIVDRQGHFLDVNETYCKMTGYPRDDLLTMSIAELEVKESKEEIRQHIAAVEQATYSRFETCHRRKDGAIIDVEVSATFQPELGGRFYVFVRDISERKQAEEERETLQAQLTQAQRMESVGRLAGGVAHDFNNMLGVILGHAELALENVDPGTKVHHDVQEIEKAAQRSADLTRQLLAFARKQTVTPRVLDLNATVSGMLTMLRRLIGENIDLEWRPAAELWPVKMDPSQLDQLLANLCVNARDAISGTGKVSIETGTTIFDAEHGVERMGVSSGEYVTLVVSDSGCGMDNETMAQAFEPFFTTKGRSKGTGLGLATVYGIVKQNRGFISVESEPGQGTTFSISLPRHIGKAEQLKAAEIDEQSALGNETVLVVEDEELLLGLSTMMLEQLGYRVLAAKTPGEAIELAQNHLGTIHLLITDVIMPEMNGRDLAARLLSLYPGLKRLFISGYTADVIAHHGVLDEGVNFLQKPFFKKQLAEKIREILE